MRVHLIRGLPGSGKSTLARVYAAQGFVHIEADDFFMAGGVYSYDKSRIADAHAACRTRLVAALTAGKNVVIANTFSRRWEMESYLEIARAFGATVTEETVNGAYQNIHGVPAEIVEAMRARWEA